MQELWSSEEMWNKKLHENSILSPSVIPNIICVCFCRIVDNAVDFALWKLVSFDKNWTLESAFQWEVTFFLWKSAPFQEKIIPVSPPSPLFLLGRGLKSFAQTYYYYFSFYHVNFLWNTWQVLFCHFPVS